MGMLVRPVGTRDVRVDEKQVCFDGILVLPGQGGEWLGPISFLPVQHVLATLCWLGLATRSSDLRHSNNVLHVDISSRATNRFIINGQIACFEAAENVIAL